MRESKSEAGGQKTPAIVAACRLPGLARCVKDSRRCLPAARPFSSAAVALPVFSAGRARSAASAPCAALLQFDRPTGGPNDGGGTGNEHIGSHGSAIDQRRYHTSRGGSRTGETLWRADGGGRDRSRHPRRGVLWPARAERRRQDHHAAHADGDRKSVV